MDIELALKAAFLGIVEGLTEFLPVSSTAHLVLAADLIGFANVEQTFAVVIQLGAILAICWHYRKKLSTVTLSLTSDKNSFNFARNILLAFIPSIIIGLTFYKTIKEVLFDPLIVCYALILGGFALILLDKFFANKESQLKLANLGVKKSIAIGFFQTLAMIPGTSRSGATIAGGLLCGLSRVKAAEFSFFLAIPTMISASAYDLYKNWAVVDNQQLGLIAIGFVTAFLSGLMVVRLALAYIAKHGFRNFGIYRIIFGSLMLAYLTL